MLVSVAFVAPSPAMVPPPPPESIWSSIGGALGSFVLVFVVIVLIVGEIALRLTPVLERRRRRRPVPPPNWSAHTSYFDFAKHMGRWVESTGATAEEIMTGPMPHLLELCFAKSDNGPVRARAMEFFRSWAEGMSEGEGASPMKERARRMVEDRIRADPDQAWLLDVFDGKLGHHSAPRP